MAKKKKKKKQKSSPIITVDESVDYPLGQPTASDISEQSYEQGLIDALGSLVAPPAIDPDEPILDTGEPELPLGLSDRGVDEITGGELPLPPAPQTGMGKGAMAGLGALGLMSATGGVPEVEAGGLSSSLSADPSKFNLGKFAGQVAYPAAVVGDAYRRYKAGEIDRLKETAREEGGGYQPMAHGIGEQLGGMATLGMMTGPEGRGGVHDYPKYLTEGLGGLVEGGAEGVGSAYQYGKESLVKPLLGGITSGARDIKEAIFPSTMQDLSGDVEKKIVTKGIEAAKREKEIHRAELERLNDLADNDIPFSEFKELAKKMKDTKKKLADAMKVEEANIKALQEILQTEEAMQQQAIEGGANPQDFNQGAGPQQAPVTPEAPAGEATLEDSYTAPTGAPEDDGGFGETLNRVLKATVGRTGAAPLFTAAGEALDIPSLQIGEGMQYDAPYYNTLMARAARGEGIGSPSKPSSSKDALSLLKQKKADEKELISRRNKLFDQFGKANKETLELISTFNKASSLAKDYEGVDNPKKLNAMDQSLIFVTAKALDPSGRISDADIAVWKGVGGMWEKLANWWTGTIGGVGTLKPHERAELLRIVGRQFSEGVPQFEHSYETFKKDAEAQGVSDENAEIAFQKWGVDPTNLKGKIDEFKENVLKVEKTTSDFDDTGVEILEEQDKSKYKWFMDNPANNAISEHGAKFRKDFEKKYPHLWKKRLKFYFE